MAKTKIEWADAVWNPITGCTPISEGCEHCYARRMATRLRGRYGYPEDDPFSVTFHKSRLGDPSLCRKPKNIFVCSMGDLFHEDVKLDWIEQVFERMREYHNHVYMLLTKRPNRVVEYWQWRMDVYLGGNMTSKWPGNVYLGVTAENQARADERIPILFQIPAAVRFVSLEPILDQVDLSRYLTCSGCGTRIRKNLPPKSIDCCPDGANMIDWVICGVETGPGARPAKSEWFDNIITQCRSVGVPVFVKKATVGVEMIREFPNGS